MKQVIDLRPVYHRKEERIRAHVLLCWLALPPRPHRRDPHPGGPRTTWRPALQRLHVGTFAGPARAYQQTTTPGADAKAVFAALDVETPPRVLRLHTPAEDPSPAA